MYFCISISIHKVSAFYKNHSEIIAASKDYHRVFMQASQHHHNVRHDRPSTNVTETECHLDVQELKGNKNKTSKAAARTVFDWMLKAAVVVVLITFTAAIAQLSLLLFCSFFYNNNDLLTRGSTH